ncbi:MAG: glycosidase, partial [Clostridia bacterium]|nr:glycosidase [Clostridia bacterium]
MAKVLNGISIPNIPWEEKPAGCKDVCWRSSHNPILTRDDIEDANSLFNSSVIAYKGEFRGVFRCDKTDMLPLLHKGKSKDGINWEIEDEPLKFENAIDGQKYEYGYDPRICELEGKYYIIWCRNAGNGNWDPTLGLAWTEDFEKFY